MDSNGGMFLEIVYTVDSQVFFRPSDGAFNRFHKVAE